MRTMILASVMLFSAPVLAMDCKHQADRSFNVDAAGLKTLEARLGATDLRLRGVPGLTQVEVRARACASDPADLERLRIDQRRDGDRLVIDADRDTFYNVFFFMTSYAWLELEIRVPDSLAVVIDGGSADINARDIASLEHNGGSGDLSVDHVSGRLAVDVGSGDVDADDVGELMVTSVGSGDVTVRKIAGNATVGRVGSGDLYLRGVGGSVQVDRVGSGDVNFYDVSGDVAVGSVGSGDVLVDGVRGNFRVDSIGSGDIIQHGVTGKVDIPSDE